jgi:drug/metabolite transporter (DMT)-like permease
MINTSPAWLRWIILLPVSLTGGFAVGYLVYIVNASQAARPDAPIVYIADFAGSLVSNLVAFYLAYEIAPKYKSQVVAVLIAIALVALFATAYLADERDAPTELIGIAGNIIGCIVGWNKYVRGR